MCGGLFSPEPLSNWLSAVSISHAIIDSICHKEQLLNVLLATNIGTLPVTLMEQCITLFQQSSNKQSKIGILMLLCTWTSGCPVAVKYFLKIDSSISFLIDFLSSHENSDDQHEVIIQSICAFFIAICIHFNDNSVTNYTKVSMKFYYNYNKCRHMLCASYF